MTEGPTESGQRKQNGVPDWMSMKLPVWMIIAGLGVGGTSVGGLWRWQENSEPRIRQIEEKQQELQRAFGRWEIEREELLRAHHKRINRMDDEITDLQKRVGLQPRRDELYDENPDSGPR